MAEEKPKFDLSALTEQELASVHHQVLSDLLRNAAKFRSSDQVVAASYSKHSSSHSKDPGDGGNG